MGKFVVRKTNTGIKFDLKAGNGEVIATSEVYASEAACKNGVESVKKEIDESVLGQTGPYRRPERLRKRKEFAGEKFKEEKVFEANE